MSTGKTASQCVHAALGLYINSPLKIYDKCIVLEVSDKKFEEAKNKCKEFYIVIDAGYTEVEPHTETAMSWYEE